jgi:hypothetical protein
MIEVIHFLRQKGELGGRVLVRGLIVGLGEVLRLLLQGFHEFWFRRRRWISTALEP